MSTSKREGARIGSKHTASYSQKVSLTTELFTDATAESLSWLKLEAGTSLALRCALARASRSRSRRVAVGTAALFAGQLSAREESGAERNGMVGRDIHTVGRGRAVKR